MPMTFDFISMIVCLALAAVSMAKNYFVLVLIFFALAFLSFVSYIGL